MYPPHFERVFFVEQFVFNLFLLESSALDRSIVFVVVPPTRSHARTRSSWASRAPRSIVEHSRTLKTKQYVPLNSNLLLKFSRKIEVFYLLILILKFLQTWSEIRSEGSSWSVVKWATWSSKSWSSKTWSRSHQWFVVIRPETKSQIEGQLLDQVLPSQI